MAVQRRASGRAHYNYFRDYDSAIGRYLESDPIGLWGGVNTYAYALARPTSLYDSLGLDVWVVINNNGFTHAGLHINTNGRIVYDPGGTYGQDVRGTGDTLTGADADLSDYIKYQQNDGSKVEVFHFSLTNEQDLEIIYNIDHHPSCPGFTCAACTSDVLDGVGPFKDLGKYLFPSSLGERLREIQQRSLVTPRDGGGGW